eukprot:GDKK01042059.1.p1 GENE.GDKK01042059.1~~GDKK01042059.1.p1  ORF type:complete len:575 (-),score=151.44 GDKK01042059.1:202-1926(-)
MLAAGPSKTASNQVVEEDSVEGWEEWASLRWRGSSWGREDVSRMVGEGYSMYDVSRVSFLRGEREERRFSVADCVFEELKNIVSKDDLLSTVLDWSAALSRLSLASLIMERAYTIIPSFSTSLDPHPSSSNSKTPSDDSNAAGSTISPTLSKTLFRRLSILDTSSRLVPSPLSSSPHPPRVDAVRQPSALAQISSAFPSCILSAGALIPGAPPTPPPIPGLSAYTLCKPQPSEPLTFHGVNLLPSHASSTILHVLLSPPSQPNLLTNWLATSLVTRQMLLSSNYNPKSGSASDPYSSLPYLPCKDKVTAAPVCTSPQKAKPSKFSSGSTCATSNKKLPRCIAPCSVSLPWFSPLNPSLLWAVSVRTLTLLFTLYPLALRSALTSSCASSQAKDNQSLTGHVASLTALHVSPPLLTLLRSAISSLASPSLSVSFSCTSSANLSSALQVTATVTSSDVSFSLVLTVPPNYPAALVESSIVAASVPKKVSSKWSLLVLKALRTRSPVEAIKVWESEVRGFAMGLVDCPICLCVAHPQSSSLPSSACPTCKNKFHSECLLKWMRTSHNSKCPLCRQPL